LGITIDGDEISAITIDGEDVQEVTIDGEVAWVAYTPYVHFSAHDDTVRKLDPDGNQIWSFTGHSDVVDGLVVDKDGYVYTASKDSLLKKISPDGNEVWSFTGFSSSSSVRSVAVDINGYIYAADTNLDYSFVEQWSNKL